VRIVTRRQQVVLEYELTVALNEAQWRPMIEIAFVAVRSLVQAVLGRAPQEAEFWFAAPKPAYAEKVRAALGVHVSYGSALNKVVLPKEWFSIASTGADSALYRNALFELQTALGRLDDPVGLRAQVERLLQTMPDGRLGADDVARALGVSRRTLTRRLGDTNTQFRDLLDHEIRTRAENFLRSAKYSRDEIAERLGYRDPTSFSRACRRWFAKSGTMHP
jgi:AraC-like DNA-binding protein